MQVLDPIGSSQEYHVQEQRDFTNPVVRFRRIRGRIVPIVNKKRVGETLTRSGQTTTLAGAAVLGGAATVAAVRRVAKQKLGPPGAGVKTAGSLMRVGGRGAAKLWRSIPKTKPTLAHKAAGAMGKTAWAALKTVAKHPGKIGLGLAALGTVKTFFGSRLEMESQLGKDILGGQ